MSIGSFFHSTLGRSASVGVTSIVLGAALGNSRGRMDANALGHESGAGRPAAWDADTRSKWMLGAAGGAAIAGMGALQIHRFGTRGASGPAMLAIGAMTAGYAVGGLLGNQDEVRDPSRRHVR